MTTFIIFDEDGLKCEDVDGGVITQPLLLNNLLTGKIQMERLFWTPKHGENFYFVDYFGDVDAKKFNNKNVEDIGLVALGNYFKTELEATAHIDEMCEYFKEVLYEDDTGCEEED